MTSCHPFGNCSPRRPRIFNHLSIRRSTPPIRRKGALLCLPLRDPSLISLLRSHSGPIKAAFLSPHCLPKSQPRWGLMSAKRTFGTVLRLDSLHHHRTFPTKAQVYLPIQPPIQHIPDELRNHCTPLRIKFNMLHRRILLNLIEVRHWASPNLNKWSR